MVSYATGTREGLDGEGCGCGMQYAHLLARTLDRHGISCYTGLHVAGGQNWKTYFSKLERADIMLAVYTPSFFESSACEKEMTEALKHKLTIVPLLFGGLDYQHHPVLRALFFITPTTQPPLNPLPSPVPPQN